MEVNKAIKTMLLVLLILFVCLSPAYIVVFFILCISPFTLGAFWFH